MVIFVCIGVFKSGIRFLIFAFLDRFSNVLVSVMILYEKVALDFLTQDFYYFLQYVSKYTQLI